MRRIVSCLLCALLLLGLCPAVRAEEGAVGIGSREELLLLADDPTGSFELTGDIDMGGEAWTPIPFSGKLNGQGHTLYNLVVNDPGEEGTTTFDGNLKEYETVFGGLFSMLKDAEVRGLNLVNAVVAVETDQHCFLGGLAGYAEHSIIEDCSVQTRNHLTLTSINAGVGGLVGFSAENSFTNCTVDAELVFTDVNKDQLCEEFLGGVYSSGCGQVDRCTVRTRGFAEVYGYAHSGGLIGMFKKVPGSSYKSYVHNTTADTEISFFEITKSRRAYCSSTIGEDIRRECPRKEMIALHYVRHESKTPAPMRPEACETPQYTFTTTPGSCTTWGYTTHTCAGCGYSYRDSYTPPEHEYAEVESTPATCTEAGERVLECVRCGDRRTETIPAAAHEYAESIIDPTCTQEGEKVYTCVHCGDSYGEPIPALGHVPGDWTVSLPPQVDIPGEEQRLCERCGVVLEWREVAALPHIYAEQVVLSAESLLLKSGQGGRLTATVLPAQAEDQSVIFTSSDETVAQVMENGRIMARNRGEAVITATSADGRASATCTVTVTFTAWQWVKYILTFGWLGNN